MPPHRPAGSVPAFLRLLVIVGASVLLLFLEHDDRWAGFLKGAEAFSVSPVVRSTPSSPTTAATTTMDRTTAFSTASSTTATILFATLQPKKKYEPKWKKKATLTEQMGAPPAFQDVGIKGDVTVVFKQGNVTKTTLAIKGQPLRDVAIQAGQFIKYGCGKGECGTCEALYVRSSFDWVCSMDAASCRSRRGGRRLTPSFHAPLLSLSLSHTLNLMRNTVVTANGSDPVRQSSPRMHKIWWSW